MIPVKKVEELVLRHKNLETELSSGKIDKKLFADKSGKSTVTSTRFYIDQESKYEDLQISCYDWADGFKFGNGTVGTDKLTVSIMTDEYFDFLDRAYQ